MKNLPLDKQACSDLPLSISSGRKKGLCSVWVVFFAIVVSALPVIAQSPTPESSSPSGRYRLKSLALPGESKPIILDYFAFDPSTKRLWVPASNTASVDVIDQETENITRIEGFATKELDLRGKKRVLGPTSVALGDGVVYIGDRGDSSICVVDAKTLKKLDCLHIADATEGPPAAPDGIIYIAANKELWVTTGAPPLGIAASDKSIKVFDASDPRGIKAKTKIELGGSAEGYAVDTKRGLFYTNIEEDGRTVAIDVRSHKIMSTFRSGCSDTQGLALDQLRHILFVTCADHVVSLDVAHDGRVMDSIPTGDGLDNIDYSAENRILYAAASNAATLTLASVDDNGKFHTIVVVPTVKGARGVVAATGGTAYLIDPVGGNILKLTPQ